MKHIDTRPNGRIHTIELTDEELAVITAFIGKSSMKNNIHHTVTNNLYNSFSNLCDSYDISHDFLMTYTLVKEN